MAPAEGFSAPGVATYDSNTMTVGDGTWDFEKNTFLLPNLQGLNFETMQYNGMGNRFSTVAQYHTLILAHGVMGALIFLLIVPISILMARFYTRKPGYAIPYHAQLQILGALMLVAVFTLGWFAVGPERSWTNPHHAIGLAIFIMFLLQIIGGRLVRNIKGRSLRKMFHRWSGRLIALLGIIQVPLGLTLYGSPKYTFILYSLWMTFLLLLYFILSYRAEGDDRGRETYISGGRSEGPSGVSYDSEYYSDVRTEKSKGHKWVAPLAAGATIAALFGRKKNKEREKELSRDRSRSRSRSRGPEVIGSRRESVSYLPSRRGSASYFDDEKYTEVDSRREDKKKGGGFMQSLFGAGAAFGAGKILSNMMKKKEKNRPHDEEYSAVSTETPRRRPSRNYPAASEFTDYTDWTEDTPPPRRGPRDGSILPPPGNPVMAAQALSAAESRTNRPQNARTRSQYSFEDSEYSSYVSPSRRPEAAPAGPAGGAGKGILSGLGLGWFAKKLADRKNKRAEEQRIREEEDMRSGVTDSRYTGDGFSSPSRDRRSRRASGRPPRPPMSALSTEITELTESSELEPRPHGTGYGRGPPMPPFSAGPPPRTPPGAGYPDSVSMPSMPPDPHGILNRGSESEAHGSPSSRPRRRDSSRRRKAGEEAAAAAVASASALAAKEESRRRTESERMGTSPSAPVSVKVRVHDDKDRNVTLRRLTEEEAAASRRDHRRRRGSMSSLSGTDAGGSGRRYRRDSSQRRAEAAAERMAEAGDTLSPPNPAFAAGRKPKDSAYYSGPAGNQPAASATVSSIGSEHTHGTWSQLSPSPAAPAGPNPTGSAAADNRRRRRQERRRSSASQRPTGVDMYD